MPTVKTAISLPAEVFEQVEEASREMGMARSQVVALALERFLARRRNAQLLEQLNAAYADSPSEEERRLLAGWQRQYSTRLAKDA